MNKQFKLIFILIITASLAYAVYESWYNLNFYDLEKKEIVNEEINHNEEDHSLEIITAINNAELDSMNGDLQLQAARVLMQHDSLNAALKYYQRFENLTESNADILAEIGMIKWNIKPSVEAMSYFTRSLRIDSTNAGALFGLARASFQINEKERAIEFFYKIIRFHPDENIAKTAEEWIKALNKN